MPLRQRRTPAAKAAKAAVEMLNHLRAGSGVKAWGSSLHHQRTKRTGNGRGRVHSSAETLHPVDLRGLATNP
jgi:hypothetical protein